MEIDGYRFEENPYITRQRTSIYFGERIHDKQAVVAKVLNSRAPENKTRFEHEYEIFVSLASQYTPTPYELTNSDNYPVIIQEKINSTLLAEILKKKLTIVESLRIAIKLTEAIEDLHYRDIIHNDINPYNIFYSVDDNKVHIIDFGGSKKLSLGSKISSASFNVFEGNLLYIAPECTGRINRDVDYRADYYSLGIVLYFMFTGELPFGNKNSPLEDIYNHIAVVPKHPELINDEIPTVLGNIIMKLIEKMPEKRYQNISSLRSDLMQCLKNIEEGKSGEDFTIATNDVSTFFQIPEKLYGREKELNTLMGVYDKVIEGNVALLLVSGASGIGKTSIVNTLKKLLIEKNGCFISGKFEQIKRNMQCAAIIGAFEEYIDNLLMENEKTISIYKGKIQNALGKNGQVLTNVMPVLEKIIGVQPDVPELDPVANQNRFLSVFQNFVANLAGPDHPMVLFVDDLQWAENLSLKLLESLLISYGSKNLLIIGAYRRNEVDESHPIFSLVENLKKQNIIHSEVVMGPLQLEHVNEMLADTLHNQLDNTLPLANICLKKTEGIPFFLVQLIYELHKDKLIFFDKTKATWTYDLEAVEKKAISSEIVEFMLNKIYHLPETTSRLISYGACIGNIFDIEMIGELSDLSYSDIYFSLEHAVKEGLVIELLGNAYQFSHDKIRQAAYSLLDSNKKSHIHIEIARFIKKKNIDTITDKQLLDVVEHYNIGMNEDEREEVSSDETNEIIALNIKAANIAKKSAAFEYALGDLRNAISFMQDPEKMWVDNYKFILNLYVNAAEMASMVGKVDLVDSYVGVVLNHTKSLDDQAKIIAIKVYSCIPAGQYDRATIIGLDFLRKMGIKLAPKPTDLRCCGMLSMKR